MTEVDLLRQHADVLFQLSSGSRLAGLNEGGDDAAPRMFLARGRRTHELWFRTDVADATADACRRVAAGLPTWDGEASAPALLEPFRAILERDEPIRDVSHGPAYRFGPRVVPRVPDPSVIPTPIDESNAHLLDRYFPYTREVLAARSPVVGVILDGWVVSACFAARKRPGAIEAGVATDGAYQRRGLAALVVAAWRDAVEERGAQPLYSTSWDNQASRSVARKLRLLAYAETLSLT